MSHVATQRRPAQPTAEQLAYGAILALGGLLFWLSKSRPSLMPIWAPWDFSSLQYLATTLTLFWFWRGVGLLPAAQRPSAWRCAAFLAGVLAVYAVLQTRFEYWSQHMFFLNRAQHVVMHHLGPFLIALGWPGEPIKRGMPGWARRVTESRAVASMIRVLQQPVLAVFLFVGLFYFWLIPSIHFRAMVNPLLYEVMNWSMVLDGILFWCLLLDPRPKPPARVSFGGRAALAVAVLFPQVLLGAVITFSPYDLYPYYDLCGRLFPSVSALNDQHIGGIISWIPPAMMSVLGLLVILNMLRVAEDSAAARDDDEASRSMAALASRWTGL
jgi:putative membrane protein